MVALANNGSELRHASATLRSDKRIILRAASNDSAGDALHFVSNKDELFTDMGFVANLIRCYKCPGFYPKHSTVLLQLPALAYQLRDIFRDVLDVVSCWSSTDDDVDPVPGLFVRQWLFRLAETQQCLARAFPGTHGLIVQFAGINENYVLIERLQQYEPVIEVIMRDQDCYCYCWVSQASRYIRWIDAQEQEE